MKKRVCLECGTPKLPTANICFVCNEATITHLGKERASLCSSCSHSINNSCRASQRQANLSDGGVAADEGLKGLLNRGLQTYLPTTIRFFHECNAYAGPKKRSPNPLSLHEREAYRLYYEVPTAFWLAPDFWDEPKSKSYGAAIALGAGAAILGAMLASKKD